MQHINRAMRAGLFGKYDPLPHRHDDPCDDWFEPIMRSEMYWTLKRLISNPRIVITPKVQP